MEMEYGLYTKFPRAMCNNKKKNSNTKEQSLKHRLLNYLTLFAKQTSSFEELI